MTIRIRDLVEVPPVQTVIRLKEGRTQSKVISESFVCTAEVHAHLNVLAAAFSRDHGTGCFLEGDFGSGKSHFLAALSVWLDNRPGADLLGNGNAALAELRSGGKRFLPVDISLVDYRSSTPLERIITTAIENAFSARGVDAVLTPMRRFIHHLGTILTVPSTARAFEKETGTGVADIESWFARDAREAFSRSLAFLEGIGVKGQEQLVDERIDVFERVMALVKESGFNGIVFIIDELSEFFRSKSDPSALNEDARTLQFLGEFASSQPLWIIAAVQESIERTGDIASATFRKIKDRFPVRFYLSTLHIRELLSGRLVRKKEGAVDTIRQIHETYRKAFPHFAIPFDEFLTVYPLHPVTLSLLEGLGELFSQHRGIVDFVHARIAGDPARDIPGILDRDANELLAPDALYDHFQTRLAEISAFHDFPRRIVPHLDSLITKIIDDDDDRILARRLIRTMVLYAVHPTAKPPAAQLLTELCACMFAPHDPLANVQFVTGAILDPLMAESRFIYRKEAPDGSLVNTLYGISATENVEGNLQARIRQAISEIRTDDSRILFEPLSRLDADLSWPGSDILRGPLTRIVMWRQSIRRAVVGLLLPGSEALLREQIKAELDSGEADFGLVLATGRTTFSLENTLVWRFCPKEIGNAVLVEYHAALTVSRELHVSNPAHAALVTPAADHLRKLEPLARQTVLELVYDGVFDGIDGLVENAALRLKRFERLLEAAAGHLLDIKYPRYREIAPRQPLSSRLYQRLLDEFVIPGTITMSEARAKGLIEVIETFAVPLGLVELKTGSYRLAPSLGEHPFLTWILSLINPSGPLPVADFMRETASGSWGVPKETAEFLLAALAQCGIIALQSQGRTLSLDLLPMTSIETADTIVAGELVSEANRDTLVNDCTFLAPSSGWGAFGLRQQREAWQTLIKFKKNMESILSDVTRQTGSFETYSAFSSFDFTSLHTKSDALAKVLHEVKVSWNAREGIERFCTAWRESELDDTSVSLIRNAHRFFDRFADKFIFIAHYLRNQSVENACTIDDDIDQRRSAVQVMLDDPLSFVIDDEGAQIGAAFELFRQWYLPLYRKRHEEHYAAMSAPPLNRLQERIARLLERLAAIPQIEIPSGVEQLLASLRDAGKSQCSRSIAEEMLRSPVCGCGYQITVQHIPSDTPDNPAAALDEAFMSYQRNLARPEILEALTAHAFALRDMESIMAERLDRLCSVLRDTTVAPRVLLDILDETTIREIERALSGSMKVEPRSLSTLFGKIGSRRLTPSRIRRMIDQWIGSVPENVLLSIDEIRGQEPFPRPSWWPSLHPGLIDNSTARVSPEEAKMLGAALEESFPAELVRKKLQQADSDVILGFITTERYHTAALRAAWLVLVKKTVGTPADFPSAEALDSSHCDTSVARAIRDRLLLLTQLQELSKRELPQRLAARTVLSALWTDEWSGAETRKILEHEVSALDASAQDWFITLPQQPVIDLSSGPGPVILLIDALPADCWLQVLEALGSLFSQAQQAWYKTGSRPDTVSSMAALFGFDRAVDPTEGFATAGARYSTLRGDEDRQIIDLLPPLSPEGAVVVRLNLVDNAAHEGKLPLHTLAGVVTTQLQHHLPVLIDECRSNGRTLFLTSDHGLSWIKGALRHGRGGVFEEVVFRAEWKE